MSRMTARTLVGIAVLLLVTTASGAAGLNAAPVNDAQRAVLALVEHWQQTYNDDVERMIADCYAPDAEVMFTGASARGHAQFLKLERAIKAAAPGRIMRIDRVLFAGDDRAIVEAVILDKARPDFMSPWIALLTVRDGRIVRDRTYLDPAHWPGIEATAGIPTPGGLGVTAPALDD